MNPSCFASFAAGMAMLLSGCDISNFDSEAKELSGGKSISTDWSETGSFSKVAARGPDNVVIETGDAFQIKATGDSAQIAKLKYVLKDGTLTVGRVKGKWSDSDAVTITITAPTLSSVAIAGSGDIKAARLSGERASVSVAGSGDADIAEIAAETLKMSIAGSGNAKLAGKTGTAEYSIAGSGALDAAQLNSTDAKISIAGSGNAKINASGAVKASIAGSGNISVSGGGKCTSSIAGSGKINCT